MFRWFKIRKYERGLLYRDQVFERILRPGRYWMFDPLRRLRLERLSVRQPWIATSDLEVLVSTGALGDEAEVVDLGDEQRALVWIDGRFAAVLGPGLSALWTVFHRVKVETIELEGVLFQHPELASILRLPQTQAQLEPVVVDSEHRTLFYVNGRLDRMLDPGRYAYWRGVANVKLAPIDLREQVLDVAGQEIMTADKVTLRLNAVLTYRVSDPERALSEVDGFEQALYRAAQLALRAVIGTRELDALLSDKDTVARELEELVRARAATFGVRVDQLGIRDLILPGEMKELLNRVTEAQKVAEANQVTRREETAAMRSQANTARILESNPTLMRLRELEVLEKVAGKAKLSVVLGEGGLTERVVKLL